MINHVIRLRKRANNQRDKQVRQLAELCLQMFSLAVVFQHTICTCRIFHYALKAASQDLLCDPAEPDSADEEDCEDQDIPDADVSRSDSCESGFGSKVPGPAVAAVDASTSENQTPTVVEKSEALPSCHEKVGQGNAKREAVGQGNVKPEASQSSGNGMDGPDISWFNPLVEDSQLPGNMSPIFPGQAGDAKSSSCLSMFFPS